MWETNIWKKSNTYRKYIGKCVGCVNFSFPNALNTIYVLYYQTLGVPTLRFWVLSNLSRYVYLKKLAGDKSVPQKCD